MATIALLHVSGAEPPEVVAITAHRFEFTPGEAGRFTVICDHFCGAGHGVMKMVIVVQ